MEIKVTDKCTMLRNMIYSKDLGFIMEAHDGLSAKIVEQTGFKGIWASGLSMSASHGVRDNNELSFKEVADHCYYMASRVNIPVLLDMDTGYGDFNTARTALRMIESAGVAGVCVEDKKFPKTNSFLEKKASSLADPEEFALKIKCMKESVMNPNFVIIARVEAYIAGLGGKEALKRAQMYADAGADAVLIHSKKSTSEDIDDFMSNWDNRVPVVIVPTKYYTVPTDHFRELGIGLVIWANHNLRSIIPAMRLTSESIFKLESLMGVEDRIATVSEVFSIQGNNELEEDEKKYQPESGRKSNVIILAASNLPDGTMKTELKISGKMLIEHQISTYKEMGIRDILAVVSNSSIPNIDAYCRVSSTFENTKELDSLKLSSDMIKEDTIISYGDLIFKKHIIRDLLESEADLTLVVDPDLNSGGDYNEYVKTSERYDKFSNNDRLKILDIHSHSDMDADGIFTGVMYIKNKELAEVIKDVLDYEISEGGFDTRKDRMADLINHLLKLEKYRIEAMFITPDSWVDINEVKDIVKANEVK